MGKMQNAVSSGSILHPKMIKKFFLSWNYEAIGDIYVKSETLRVSTIESKARLNKSCEKG